jgi:hypothetical protein
MYLELPDMLSSTAENLLHVVKVPSSSYDELDM